MGIKKQARRDGTFDLSFKYKGDRVRAGQHMSLPLVVLLFPVSCAVSSPLPLMTFDRAAARDAFPTGSAVLWIALALALWAVVVRTYNSRRSTLKGRLHVYPARGEEYIEHDFSWDNDAFNVHSFAGFDARVDAASKYSTFNYGVYATTDGREFRRVVKDVSKDTAQAIARELRAALKKDA